MTTRGELRNLTSVRSFSADLEPHRNPERSSASTTNVMKMWSASLTRSKASGTFLAKSTYRFVSRARRMSLPERLVDRVLRGDGRVKLWILDPGSSEVVKIIVRAFLPGRQAHLFHESLAQDLVEALFLFGGL